MDNQKIKFRQKLNDRLSKYGQKFHYWGYIDDSFIGPIGENSSNSKGDQYTGLKDANGVEICKGDLLNIHFTSDNGNHIHDCIYKAEIGVLGDIQFSFVKLMWLSHGFNQYPSSNTLCARYNTLDYEYKNNEAVLKVPDSYGENSLYGKKWKQNDKSFYFKVIGNIHENPELLEN